MAFMDEAQEQEVGKNKAIRGYIIRALAKGNQNALLVRQITNALVGDGYNAYRRDAVIKLTRKGVDLVEGTIDDPGVDV